MKRYMKWLVVLTLFLLSFLSQPRAGAGASGAFGGLNWNIRDGVLTISGEGTIGSADIGNGEMGSLWRGYADEITRVEIAEGITGIGSWAFHGLDYLAGVSIPSSVTTIGFSAFHGCAALRDVAIPDGVTYLGSAAFYGCASLTDIAVPGSVGVIRGGTFSRCAGLRAAYIGDGVTSIGENAFYHCQSLLSVRMPLEGVSVHDTAFTGCDQLSSVSVQGRSGGLGWSLSDNGTLVIGGYGAMADFAEGSTEAWLGYRSAIRRAVIMKGVTAIGNRAFEDCTALTDIAIPDSVTSIRIYAFQGCTALKEATLPSSLKTLKADVFRGCTSLIGMAIPEGITALPTETFRDCSALKWVDLPDSCASIGTGAFSRCVSLERVRLGERLTAIGEYAFFRCLDLKTLDVPPGVSSCPYTAFEYCSADKYTTMNSPASKVIGIFHVRGLNYTIGHYTGQQSGTGKEEYYLYRADKSATDVDIIDGIATIGDYAFDGCTGLRSVTIPQSVTRITPYAFRGCASLTNVTIPDSVTLVGAYSFSGCTRLSSVKLGRGVKMIDTQAFYGCKSLTSVDLPEGLTQINPSAFAGCALTNVVIPKSVTSIYGAAFPSSVRQAYFSGDDGITIESAAFSGRPTVYCREFTDVDFWATKKGYSIVYTDAFDPASIRELTLPAAIELPLGGSAVLDNPVFPQVAPVHVAWLSSAPDVVSAVGGVIEAHAEGTAIIMAKAGDLTASMTVTVYMPPQRFELNTAEAWVIAKETLQLEAINLVPAHLDPQLTWSSSDISRASVSNTGLVRTFGIGDVIISAENGSGFVRTCLVHMCYPVTAIEFDRASRTVTTGATVPLKAQVTMRTQSCVNRLVTFDSSDPSAASVDESGIITGHRPGTATIKATAQSGVTASCVINVRGVATLRLPAGLRAIESEAFAGFSDVDVIVIPDSVTLIAEDAFRGREKVTIRAGEGSYALNWAESHGFRVSVRGED